MLNIISYQRNANQKHNETYSRMDKIKKISTDKAVEELELSYTASGTVKWYSHFGQQPGSSSEVNI